MGQQQLILLVLATVIVGVAIIVGIAAFTENSAKSNADAMTQDAIRIAQDYQAHLKKPAPMRLAATPGAPTLEELGYDNPLTYTSTPATSYANTNGTYTIAYGTATGGGIAPLCITGVGTDEGISAEGAPLGTQINEIKVGVTGVNDDDIAAGVFELNDEVASPAPAVAGCP